MLGKAGKSELIEGFRMPLVSITIPMRNEVRCIRECLASVFANEYPQDRLEVIVVDGKSNDGSREIVESLRKEYRHLRLLDNPRKVTPAAMNVGVSNARGEVIVTLCAHGFVARDFVLRCVESLRRHPDADCVGGRMKGVSDTFVGCAIALASNSPFGAGGARYRSKSNEGYTTDIVPHPAYRKEVFLRMGLFDEDLLRDQDEEFEYRLIRKGGRVYFDPRIQSYAHTRSSLETLGRQYFQYGYWKVRVLQKHPLPASWRHLVPGAFVVTLLGSGVSAIFQVWGSYLFGGILVTYLVFSLAFALLAARNNWRYFFLLPLVFATIHVSYGLGFLEGLLRFGLLRRHLTHPFRDETLTR